MRSQEKLSTLSGFYLKPINERKDVVRSWAELSTPDMNMLANGGLSLVEADLMIENVVGVYNLPFGIATNFLINDRNYLVPMVVEEPSVVAACSFAAKLFRERGGFRASSDDPIMIGQIQLLDLEDLEVAIRQLGTRKAELLNRANETAGSIASRGGGAIDLVARPFRDTPVGDMVILHLYFDVRDAMGANAINSAVEHLAPLVEEITGARVNLRILSNLCDKRKARAEGVIPAAALATNEISGRQVVDAILEAAVFAELDPYRAATHNKGIMNGIDALMIATGNDWRATEAGAHAFAAQDAGYTSLSKWWKDEAGDLRGSIELPLAVGIVGGATRVHPVAQVSLKMLNVESAQQLAEVAAAVGLAQNLAAIRALATDGIQSGHMRMHARQLALAAGAAGNDVLTIAHEMIYEGNIRLERAKALVRQRKQRS